MAKVIAICGKICSGKTYYAKKLKKKERAVILSCDELTAALFDNNLGEKHDEIMRKVWSYFQNKSVELVEAGCSVILDWGFWTRENRKALTAFCEAEKIELEWHYVEVTEAIWQRNIRERNQRVERGEGGSDYYLDEGLLAKLETLWEEPAEEEIEIRYIPD